MNILIKSVKRIAVATLAAVLMLAHAQAQTPASKLTYNSLRNRSEFRLGLFRFPAGRESLLLRPAGFSLMPRSASINAGPMTSMAPGPNLQVFGSGTLGRLTKWAGFTSSSSSIGDSTIFEDKFGKVGIGTDSPTSRLTVTGMIESTLGGLKFPDGTVQTTAGLASLFRDATLTGNGTSGSPLGVAIPLNLTGSVSGSANNILTIVNTAGGSGVSVTAGGNGVRSVGGKSSGDTSPAGAGVIAVGGNSSSLSFGGGAGVFAFGGSASEHDGGAGVVASGGSSSASGGTGVSASGGAASGTAGGGGAGVNTAGGSGPNGGDGVIAKGGNSTIDNGAGGTGVVTTGGRGSLSDGQNRGGTGLLAIGGEGANGAMRGFAGIFLGDLEVRDGNFAVLAGGTKNFKIDHPLDPENKYLYHAAIESSEVLNVYSGNVTTNKKGEATVSLPDWFETINRDFRYQLTVVGTFAQAIVADEIQKNRFRIRTSVPGVKVSWQVIGVRSDAAFLRHPFKVEEDKPQGERGTYLSPEAYDQPKERGVDFARHPEMMRRIKETHLKQMEESKSNKQ